MAIKCPQCGAEYDVTLFTFDRSIRCDCGAIVNLRVGHEQKSDDGSRPSIDATGLTLTSVPTTMRGVRKRHPCQWPPSDSQKCPKPPDATP